MNASVSQTKPGSASVKRVRREPVSPETPKKPEMAATPAPATQRVNGSVLRIHAGNAFLAKQRKPTTAATTASVQRMLHGTVATIHVDALLGLHRPLRMDAIPANAPMAVNGNAQAIHAVSARPAKQKQLLTDVASARALVKAPGLVTHPDAPVARHPRRMNAR